MAFWVHYSDGTDGGLLMGVCFVWHGSESGSGEVDCCFRWRLYEHFIMLLICASVINCELVEVTC